MSRHTRRLRAVSPARPCHSALHLLDIENLCLGRVRPSTCSVVWDHYLHQVGVSPRDQIVVAANSVGAASAFFSLPGSARRLLVPATPDAADHALIDSVDLERVALRHDTVFIASGDRAFAPLAHDLRARGLRVVQVVATGARVAAELYVTCDEFRQLPGPVPRRAVAV
jgi:hypothetical protein